MNEHRTLLATIRVEMTCGSVHCNGMMVYAGISITESESSHQHICSTCGVMKWSDQKYPHLAYEAIA